MQPHMEPHTALEGITMQDKMRSALVQYPEGNDRGFRDFYFTVPFLDQIKACESCGASVKILDLIRADPYDSCICKVCDQLIVTGVWFYFPGGVNNRTMSIAKSLDELRLIESRRD